MALRHEQPDRPPVSATYTPEIVELLRSVYGRPEEDLGYVMGNDLIKTTVGIELSYHRSNDPVYTCPFGVTFRNVKNFAGAYTEIIDGALRDDPDGEKLAAYKLPDPDDPAWYRPVKAAVERYGREKFIIGSCQCSIFETSWYLHGMEDTLCDMIADVDYAEALFDKVMQFPLKAGLNLIDCGVDMVWLGDDVATQRDMMFSLGLWRKLLKPRYAKIFAALKEKRPNIVLAYHSCGNCEQILDDMVEIGLNVLNPIQPLSMDPVHIKRRYGKQLTLFGAIDVQNLLPFGTPGEIRESVREAKRVLGEGGGYILSPAHHIQSDTSLQNIQAFYEEAFQ
jgi:uroporphyrinogen decarboxylase